MDQPHLDRERAQSFGRVALQYDCYRPTYPDALIDDFVALLPADVLDVGCGTGQIAAALAGRGVSVLGVEPDEQMAAVARGRGIPVDVAAFETWDDSGRRFDLITCGAAWHWIDPALGLAKAARVLRPGATLARFWNYEVPDGPAAAALESVYGKLAPNATRFWRPSSGRSVSRSTRWEARSTPRAAPTFVCSGACRAGESARRAGPCWRRRPPTRVRPRRVEYAVRRRVAGPLEAVLSRGE